MLKIHFNFQATIILIQLVCIILTCSSCGNKNETIEKGLEIFPDKLVINEISIGSSIDTVVFIKNNTDSDAKILSIIPSCECISVKNSDTIISSHDSIPISLEIIPEDIGEIYRIIDFETSIGCTTVEFFIHVGLTKD